MKNKKLILISFSIIIIILAGFGFAGEALSVYFATGTLISTNLLDGANVDSIDSFFASTTLPSASTTLYAQFATTSTSGSWYNATGTLNGTTSIANGTSSTDLSGLNWSGPNFYYKMYFNTSDASNTPELDEIKVDYTFNGSLYDFNTCAYSNGQDCWGYATDTSATPTSPSVAMTEATAGQYSSASTSDNTRWTTDLASSDGDYDSQVYTFTISESTSSITQIDVLWEGYGETEFGYTTTLDIWNASTSAWVNLDSIDFTVATDQTASGARSTNLDYYIDNNSNLSVLVTTKKYVAFCPGTDLDNCGDTQCISCDWYCLDPPGGAECPVCDCWCTGYDVACGYNCY